MALRERPTVLVFWVTYEEMAYFLLNCFISVCCLIAYNLVDCHILAKYFVSNMSYVTFILRLKS